MLRILLSTLFLFASAIPAFAGNWSCTWCRARGGPGGAPAFAPSSSVENVVGGGLDGTMTLSVIYPGIVVLMTMTAHYFLKIMEPQSAQDNPRFVRGAAGLSALWLLGFYPFLTSAVGGFLFCVTAVSCTGAWILIRRFGLQMRLWERLVVFWSFFFFSLLAGLLATGYGTDAARFFEQSWTASRDTGLHLGPLFMIAVNAAALVQIFRIAGFRVPRPTDPDSIMRAKVYGLVLAAAVFDTFAAESHTLSMEWITWILLALPSLAYCGIYWLVARLPKDVRARVSFVLFVLLALFLILLACLAAGASGQTMFLFTLALGFMVSLGWSVTMLWQSRAAGGVKASLSAAAAALIVCTAYHAVMLVRLPVAEQAAFIANQLVLTGWKSLACLLLAYGCGICFILEPKFAARTKYILSSAMIFFLLLGLRVLSAFLGN